MTDDSASGASNRMMPPDLQQVKDVGTGELGLLNKQSSFSFFLLFFLEGVGDQGSCLALGKMMRLVGESK